MKHRTTILALSILLAVLAVLSSFASAADFAPVQKGYTARGRDVLPYAPDRILVKFTSSAFKSSNLNINIQRGDAVSGEITGIASVDALSRDIGAQKIYRAYIEPKNGMEAKRLGVERWYIIDLPEGSDIEQAVDKYSDDPGIEYAKPDYRAFPAAVPSDPLYPDHWGHNNTAQLPEYDWGGTWDHTGPPVGTVGFDANAEGAWDGSQGFGSSSIIIAILDSGVDLDHPDLNLVSGYDFGDNDSNPDDDSSQPGHGTCCAGVAASLANNGIGAAGAAPGCRIMPCKVANSAGSMYFSYIENAIYWAADNGADVISMSLGAAGVSSDPATDAALEYAYNQGVVILAATGNENNSTISYPAINQYVIGVGAASPCGDRKRSSSNSSECNPGVYTDPNGYTCDGERWWGSNYGVNSQDAAGAVDVIAPTIVPTTDIAGSGGYQSGDYEPFFNGTSCSTPYAAGVCGLIKSKNPGWTASQIRDQLRSTAIDIQNVESGSGWDRYSGYGMVDAEAAVGGGGTAPVADFSGSPTSGDAPLTVYFTDASTGSPTSWSWDFGDGGTSTAQNPSHEYTAAGSYTVQLTATNSFGSDAETKVDYITVTEPGTGFCDNFDDGDASDWTVVSGTWSVVSGQLEGYDASNYVIDLAPCGDVSDGTITVDWTSLSGGSWTNGIVVFGYQDADNYRAADCRDGANKWTIREYIGGAQYERASLSETINTNQKYALEVNIDASGLVTVTVDGVQKVSYNFGNIQTGRVGLAVQKAQSQFDNYCVTGASTPDPPVAEFSGTPTSGDAPLTVNFTDASTNNPTSWSWDFGDGGTSTEQNPSYVYTSPGRYTVELTAANAGGSDTETKTSYINVSKPTAETIGEVAQITRSQNDGEWYSVTLNNTYTDPVVVMKTLTFNGSHPTHLRVRNVTSGGFEWQMEEWEYKDGNHTTEDCPYMVVESGLHTLEDGTVIEAGTIDVTDSWSSVSLSGSFSSPVLLTGVMSNNDATPVVTRTRNLDTGGFDIKVQEEEVNDGTHGAETVAWIVIENGSGTNGGADFLAGRTTNSVTHNWYTISFSSSFSSTPIFLCHDDTYDGNNTCAARYRNLGTSSVEVFIEEEGSSDSEINHTTEAVSYLAWGNAGDITTAGGLEISEGGTRILTAPAIPDKLTLGQNYPNPFNPSTTIRFGLDKPGRTVLEIFDVSGRRIAKLIDRRMEAGYHTKEWNASGIASGVYFYRLRFNGRIETRKMVLLR